MPEVAYCSTPCIFHVIHLGVLPQEDSGFLFFFLSLPRIHCVTIDVSYVISLRWMDTGYLGSCAIMNHATVNNLRLLLFCTYILADS